MIDAIEVLKEEIESPANVHSVTLPRQIAREILDQLEGRGFTDQQGALFRWLEPGQTVTAEEIRQFLGCDTESAARVAIWRLGKALKRSSLPYKVCSVIGQGYKVERTGTV